MIAPPLVALLEGIQALMREAHRLGCYRTAEALHAALNTGRAEVWEALPPTPGPSSSKGHFVIGPVAEQPE